MPDRVQLKERRGITACGYFVIDRIRQIDAWPQEEGLAEILGESMHNGGGPSNLLIDLSRMGADFPLRAVGRIGDDENGRLIVSNCRNAGLNTDGLTAIPGVLTAASDVMSCRKTGRRTFFFQRGASAQLDASYINGHPDESRIFYIGYPLLLDQLDHVSGESSGYADVLKQKKQAGQMTAMDLVSIDGPLAAIVIPALPFIDYLFLNDQECLRLTGISVREQNRPKAAAVADAFRKLHELGLTGWAVLHMPEACWAWHSDHGLYEQPGVDLPKDLLKGTNGAGDALAAACLFAVHEGYDMQTALEWGVSAASSCLRSFDSTDGVASIGNCLESARRYGFRRSREA